MTPEEKTEYLALKKERGRLKTALEFLTDTVTKVLALLDEEMKKPCSRERGKRIAHLCNALNIQNDTAMHFGLGISFKSKKWRP